MRLVPEVASGAAVPRSGSAKVVFVNRYFHPDESATSRLLGDLAFRLASAGIEVAVVTSRQLYDNPGARLSPREIVMGVTVHRVATATMGRANLAGRALDYSSFHAAAGVKLFSVVSAGDVVVAKTDPPLISIVAACVAGMRRAHLVNWLQDLFPEVATALGFGAIPAWLRNMLLSARDASLRRAAANIVLGERMQGHVLQRGLDATRIHVIPNWTDVSQITPQSVDTSITRREAGLSEQFVIGYSGNLGRAHEFETLLGAARLLRNDRRVSFLITGGGAKAAALRETVRAEQLSSFHFLPYQPAHLLSDSLAASDVHLVSLLPALEGLIVPSKLYGILAAGRPAVFIGDPDGEVARVIRRHDCGVAVGVGDSSRLAAELRTLSEAPMRLEALSANARRLAMSHYTTEHAVAAWSGLLKSIAPQLTAAPSSHAKYCVSSR
jgi:colanic acid biosynthesis glycosyl transferase WcaI